MKFMAWFCIAIVLVLSVFLYGPLKAFIYILTGWDSFLYPVFWGVFILLFYKMSFKVWTGK